MVPALPLRIVVPGLLTLVSVVAAIAIGIKTWMLESEQRLEGSDRVLSSGGVERLERGAWVEAWTQGSLSLVILLGVSVLVWWVLHRLIHRRMQRILAGVDQVARGERFEPILLTGADELAQLAQAVDLMASTLARQRDQLQRQAAAAEAEAEQRRRSEARLEASERRFAAMFRASPVGLVVTEAESRRILDANPAFERLVESGRDVLLGRTFAEIGLSLRADEPTAGTWRGNDGRERFVEVVAEPFEHAGEALRLEVVEDVTARRISAMVVRESEERYRQLVEHSNELVAEIDPAGRVLFASPALRRLLGCAGGEGIDGAEFLSLIHEEDRAAAAFAFQEQRGAVLVRARAGPGDWRWLEASGRRFHRSDGAERLVVLARDVTERKRHEKAREALELQVQQAQRLEAMGTLAGGIAHDFNNILTGLLTNAEIAQLILSDQDPVRPNVDEIVKGCNRARDLVRQILAFSRRQEQPRARLRLRPVVSEALQFLRAGLPATVQIRSELSQDGAAVLADGSQIHQIVVNLCTNAAYAMRHEGRIDVTLRLTHVPEDAGGNTLLTPGRYVCLEVSDTGCGMDAATMERIFEPFFTTKPPGEGTGLGLSVVHGIVTQHGGAIAVSSEVGRGSVFQVYFPAITEEAVVDANVRQALPSGSGQRILLVDDEPAIVQSATGLLHCLGYEVDAFTSPEEAVDAFLGAPARYDAVITDLTMPRRSGLHIAREVRVLRPDLPVFVATGFAGVSMGAALPMPDATKVLSKPFEAADLARALHRAFHPPASEAARRPEGVLAA